ncbi:hypothetical protein [Rhodococcus sp. Leaf233]|uniref:hypothetical protein n=1 Tax=Rhodococcus sp. Leaf233 TaxID=1736302 RepID=UPI00070BA3CD|nr:hypothetical protein [Rhodococcus sp. Leaf233]KQU33527.1 hypothetical protein ASH04_06730 [Rhodococcus sp. Leaf233]
MSEKEEPTYGLVMPFIAVESNGGTYEDAAYVAGWELGVIDGQLAGPNAPTPEHPGPPLVTQWRWINEANAKQADLLAMKHGMKAEFDETYEGYISVRFVPAEGGAA